MAFPPLRSFAPALVAGLFSSAPLAAQGPVYKLNPPLAREHTREVTDARISPDGAWVVYRADPGLELELFSIPIRGGRVPLRLNAPSASHESLEITRDGRFVVYESSGRIQRVPVQGGRNVELAAGTDFRLSPDGLSVLCLSGWSLLLVALDGSSAPLTLVPGTVGTYLSDLRFSPDSSRVVYRGSATRQELFSAPSDASSAPVKLNGPLVGGGNVDSFEISPDGTRVVYLADQQIDSTFELFSAPIDGSAAPVRVHPAFSARKRVRFFEVLPGSRRVVYTADQEQRGVFELFSASLDGLEPVVKLNRALPAGGQIYFFSTTPDGRWIVYFGEQDVNDVSENYVVASDASIAPRKLNDPLAPGSEVSTGQLSPAGTHLVYTVAGELFSVPILRDVAATPLAGSVSIAAFQISPDGTRVVFSGHVAGVGGLFSVPIGGGAAPVQLNPPLASPSANVYPSVLISPDSKSVVFRAEKNVEGLDDLFSAPIDGRAAAVQLSPTLEGEIVADVLDIQVSPGGVRALFRIDIPDGSDGSRSELYGVTFAEREPVRLFPFGSVGTGERNDLGVMRFTHDGARAVFRAGSEEGEDLDLFSVPVGGGEAPVRLNDRLGSGYGPGRFELPRSGGVAVYVQEDDDDTPQLFAVPVDGSSGPTQLTVAGADQFGLAPDGTRVAFSAKGATSSESALFSVPTDASSAPLQLIPTLTAPRGTPYELRIDPGSRFLVYSTDQDAGDVLELYSVPLDGSAAPKKLSTALPAGGDVLAGIVLAGGRALYRADQEADERFELYSVPLDGSAPPVKLSGALVAGGDVREAFEVAPEGRRVVYLADQEADERFELFSAPLDGSAPPVKLNAPLVAGGDVVSPGPTGPFVPGGSLQSRTIPFRITPDGTRVVYRADQVRDEVFELYSVPIDRSAPPLQISGVLPAGGDVLGEFEIDADGREVLYVADQGRDEVFELFRTPIDRIKQSRRISAPLVEGGDVVRVRTAPDSRSLYLADQDVDGALELYLTSSGRRERLFLPR